ncbi:hypothetical protein MGYG_09159 [Nannizzia gypsea CBS 118893]|uniref:Uncharacterized protein n=1 Tax=Arthroderma gypseum (strain ATCC MYA-4604 / CBS 118893) TaxID=535722 RepID=E4V3E8_ARTGP|nr:hypothetical protein MGYG_09159 [Nannizzia gypsea CBS 118893]EFR04522.1 hypothetical protein MGYG_09159 [Nannizzia gypsea CBS 118893]
MQDEKKKARRKKGEGKKAAGKVKFAPLWEELSQQSLPAIKQKDKHGKKKKRKRKKLKSRRTKGDGREKTASGGDGQRDSCSAAPFCWFIYRAGSKQTSPTPYTLVTLCRQPALSIYRLNGILRHK